MPLIIITKVKSQNCFREACSQLPTELRNRKGMGLVIALWCQGPRGEMVGKIHFRKEMVFRSGQLPSRTLIMDRKYSISKINYIENIFLKHAPVQVVLNPFRISPQSHFFHQLEVRLASFTSGLNLDGLAELREDPEDADLLAEGFLWVRGSHEMGQFLENLPYSPRAFGIEPGKLFLFLPSAAPLGLNLFGHLTYNILYCLVLLDHFLMVAFALAFSFGAHEFRQSFKDLPDPAGVLLFEVLLRGFQECYISVVLFDSPAMVHPLPGLKMFWLKELLRLTRWLADHFLRTKGLSQLDLNFIYYIHQVTYK